MNVLVTGGAGFIGSHLCQKLVEDHTVVAIDNLNDYYPVEDKKSNLKLLENEQNFTFHQIDILEKKKLGKLFDENEFDVVIHLAARAGVRFSVSNPDLYVESNIQGTLNLLEVLKEKNIKLVFSSSSSVYGDNSQIPFKESETVHDLKSPYAITKYVAEMLCKNYHDLYGLKIVVLRFFTVYGPRGRPDMAPYIFLSSVLKQKPITMFGDGSSSRDYTYVSDIVSGIIASMNAELDFEIINLSYGSSVKLLDFIHLIEKHTGKKAIVKQEDMPKVDVEATFADISKAKKLLGYSPKVDIDQGIQKMCEWYKSTQDLHTE